MNIGEGKEKEDENRERDKPQDTVKYREQSSWALQGDIKWVIGIKEGTFPESTGCHM